jgi:hypothetical protein
VLAPLLLIPLLVPPFGTDLGAADDPGPGSPPRAQAALGQPATHVLWFVMNGGGTTADHGALAGGAPTVLGTLADHEIAQLRPGLATSAVKAHARAEFECLLGDEDGDGDFWDDPFDDIDAIGVRRYGPAIGRLAIDRLLVSSQDAVLGGFDPLSTDLTGAVDGTIFALSRDTDGSPRVERFLTEAQIVRAIGQHDAFVSDGVDVDAFAQDATGNIFLSFRHDEQVNGTLLHDDGVVCLPESGLGYSTTLDVASVVDGSAVIVLDRPRVNALVSHAALISASGNPIGSLIDLQALEIDPDGGSFTPVQPIPGQPGAPNLLFSGQAVGPTVLTTADDGRVATLNGAALGASDLNGSALGLDPSVSSGTSADLNGVLVLPSQPAPLCLDVVQGEVDLHAPDGPPPLSWRLGNAPPLAPLLLLVDVIVPVVGGGAPSLPAPHTAFYPDVFALTPVFVWPVNADAGGRLAVDLPVAAAPPVGVLVVLQVADLLRRELSPPAAIWCP